MADGLSQVFARLALFNKTVRQAARTLFSGGGWTYPMYDFQNGIAAVDTQYGFPQFLAALWPGDRIDSFYTFYVLLNYYLTGLSFVYFGWWFRQKTIPVLAGAVSYAFCGFALFAGVRHPHFITPMMLLPLLVVGVEKVMRRERSWLLTVTVFLSETSLFGVYFSCMQAAFLGLYVCVRFFDLYREHRVREFVHVWLRLALWGMPGALLGCFTALPTLASIVRGDRLGADIWGYTNPWCYSENYYTKFISKFFVADGATGSWMHLGLSALCFPGILLLFTKKAKGGRTLRILFLILTAMHLIPAVAYVMSGFSNISNRFCFGYAFCVSAILMFMLPRLGELSRRGALLVGAFTTAYAAAAAALLLEVEIEAWQPVGLAVLVFSVWAVCLYQIVGRKGSAKRALPAVCLAVTVVSVLYTSFLTYDGRVSSYLDEFADAPYGALAQGQYASLAQSAPVREGEGFFRVGGDNISRQEENYAGQYGLNGVTSYPYYGRSIRYGNWLQEWELPWIETVVHGYAGEIRAAEFQTLSGIRYYASRNSDQWDWPYGFHEVDRITNGENTDVILENENWLPLGYTYNKYMTREDYKQLSALDRRQAQMQAVVLDDAPISENISRQESVASELVQIPWETAEANGVSWQDGKVRVEWNYATMTLRFQSQPDTETYLRVQGLNLTRRASNRRWALMVTTENTYSSGFWQADAYVYAHHQHTQTMDLGYSHEGIGWVTLTFPQKGIYKLEDIQIWCQSMDGFAAQAAALRAEPLEDIKTNWRGLSGRVELSEDKILCLALPWLDGWTAKVDGQPAALLHANTAFMGLELPAGEHEIQLQYWMPGLTKGLVLTALGALGCAGLALVCRRKEKLHK